MKKVLFLALLLCATFNTFSQPANTHPPGSDAPPRFWDYKAQFDEEWKDRKPEGEGSEYIHFKR